MWVLAMFDLPMRTPEARRCYARFRQRLLSGGFLRLQRSIYARHCPSDAAAEAQFARLVRAIPAEGEVRLLAVTDRQFGRMRSFSNASPAVLETPPGQLQLF